MQMHLALSTARFDDAVAFYTDLLGVEPAKQTEDYATFRAEAPAVRLSLRAGERPAIIPGEHYGIYIPDADALRATWARLAARGHEGIEQAAVSCCMAIQDKLWLSDPDGRLWEVYTVLQDQAVEDQGLEGQATKAQAPAGACCGGAVRCCP